MAVLGNNSIGGSTYAASTQSHLISGTAPSSGSLTQLFIYCKGNSGTSTSLIMAIYADSSGNPGTRIGTSNVITVTNGTAAGWIECDLTSSVIVTSGTTYWIAMSDNGGGATFAYTTSGTTKGRGGYGLPDPYGAPGWTDSAYFSMYANIGAVPTNSIAPTISGSSTDGSTLTSTAGNWTNSPSSYTYQWTRAGVNITGATSSTYVVQLADRTYNIRCAVTAHNGSGDSSAVNSSNSITGSAPSAAGLGHLKWAPPAQNSPITIDLTASPGNYYATWSAGADYIVNLSTTIPRYGELEIDANGARSVKIIGGVWALNDTANGALNYHIHIHNLVGWAFIEGQEADMANTNADFLSASGGTTYTPDIYFQNCRIINLTATDNTNHADIFQPQGLVKNVCVDKLTFSSNYQGFTIASDGSTGSLPGRLFKLSRINSWYSAANNINPYTAFYWLNGADSVSGHDTAPFPLVFDDVWCDLSRGAGRSAYSGQISRVIYPAVLSSGSGQAGGGTLVTGGSSPLTNGEVIGAVDANDQSYAYIANSKMKVGGVLWSGSPSTARSDVVTEDDSLGSFVPVGIGTNYNSPGYVMTPEVKGAVPI